MTLSRLMSLIEAIANVAAGCGVAVTAQLLVFPGLRLLRRVFEMTWVRRSDYI